MTSRSRHRCPGRVTARATAALLVLAAAATRADPLDIPSFSAAALGTPPAAWKFATLPHKIPTLFTIAELEGEKVLKVEAQESYGNLVHSVHATPSAGGLLSWRWRVDKLVDGADLRTRAGDDSPAKVCLFFAFDESHLSVGQRAKLSLARATLGEDLPSQALCYVWDNKIPAGTSLDNAFTPRIRMIVLESGTDKLGHWVDEKRDFAADYSKLFGDESGGQIPDISGIAISADADNTHGHSLAYFGDIKLAP